MAERFLSLNHSWRRVKERSWEGRAGEAREGFPERSCPPGTPNSACPKPTGALPPKPGPPLRLSPLAKHSLRSMPSASLTLSPSLSRAHHCGPQPSPPLTPAFSKEPPSDPNLTWGSSLPLGQRPSPTGPVSQPLIICSSFPASVPPCHLKTFAQAALLSGLANAYSSSILTAPSLPSPPRDPQIPGKSILLPGSEGQAQVTPSAGQA